MEEKILEAMKRAEKPLRSGEIAEMIGEEGNTVSKAIARLKKEGKITSPKRCYYAPADV
ncbi:MarR family transcriptional regulator [Desulfonema ishimotonii]|uniref:MarR family transcriptional regulator n=1 Tax=Desulfonema ishimotonii TaxID=45657 RepID=A0A401G324_9BACT|nr:HTH domain-containing protein [Desulfonema ishimotonii]GBC63581.1 MarR family transcriptional regulator [Desulfonema ishimotonii]